MWLLLTAQYNEVPVATLLCGWPVGVWWEMTNHTHIQAGRGCHQNRETLLQLEIPVEINIRFMVVDTDRKVTINMTCGEWLYQNVVREIPKSF